MRFQNRCPFEGILQNLPKIEFWENAKNGHEAEGPPPDGLMPINSENQFKPFPFTQLVFRQPMHALSGMRLSGGAPQPHGRFWHFLKIQFLANFKESPQRGIDFEIAKNHPPKIEKKTFFLRILRGYFLKITFFKCAKCGICRPPSYTTGGNWKKSKKMMNLRGQRRSFPTIIQIKNNSFLSNHCGKNVFIPTK